MTVGLWEEGGESAYVFWSSSAWCTKAGSMGKTLSPVSSWIVDGDGCVRGSKQVIWKQVMENIL